ncbi:hypothetical protein BFF78_20455 [Streptomyces fodineus]|uniref:Uncharacterized protein n=1 Tax=Streptomyces fodineus TaxID=1904616 RepID=A0A1D7YCB6_9ACTN|nr:hypothetical protein [Streptomyces fodineus]AOR33120.1 hypothetical protein BFF78_20455 [Streptomyces fodineus]
MRTPELPEAEIRATFERALEQGLQSPQVADALRRPGGTLDRGRLRTRALQARDDIVSAAAVEYREFVEARAGVAAGTEDRSASDGPETGVSGAGGGPLPVLAVLVTSLAVAAAAVCLITGFVLLALGGRPYIGEGLVTSGLIAGAVAVGGAIGDLAYFVVAAARRRPADQPDAPEDAVTDAARAREEWELALLERGVLPFLLGRLEESSAAEHEGRRARRSARGL